MSIKVLHVIARMNVGGTAKYVGELIENIPNSQLATGYVQDSEIEDSVLRKIQFIRIPHLGRRISPLNDFLAWRELKRIIKEQRPEIVHTHTFKAGLIGRLVAGEHKRVHTFHGHLFGDETFPKLIKYVIKQTEKFLAFRTDYFISVGERVGEEIRNKKIGVNNPWKSIPPGIKPLNLIDKQTARKSLGIQNKGIIFGWLARMTDVKNPELLIAIAKKLPQIQFAMAGGGNLLNKIKAKAPANLKIIGWTDASLFWSAVDCAISTSHNEGIPIALIEAQFSCLPIIATNVGGNSEVVLDKVTGFLASPNAESFVECIKIFEHEKTLMIKMGKIGLLNAQKKFSIKSMILEHLDLYDTISN
jgi:glycosyltransferase involved in cell wall biosynthesis